MEKVPYPELTDSQLLALCCWREARGESLDAKIAQCWSVRNRVDRPGWWGHDWQSVILKPWQYSSFNWNDPNVNRWPEDDSPSWGECQQAAEEVMLASVSDPTNGATHYYDVSITFPKAWGKESEWENTLNVGRLKFWKMKPNVFPADVSAQGDV